MYASAGGPRAGAKADGWRPRPPTRGPAAAAAGACLGGRRAQIRKTRATAQRRWRALAQGQVGRAAGPGGSGLQTTKRPVQSRCRKAETHVAGERLGRAGLVRWRVRYACAAALYVPAARGRDKAIDDGRVGQSRTVSRPAGTQLDAKERRERARERGEGTQGGGTEAAQTGGRGDLDGCIGRRQAGTMYAG